MVVIVVVVAFGQPGVPSAAFAAGLAEASLLLDSAGFDAVVSDFELELSLSDFEVDPEDELEPLSEEEDELPFSD